MKPETSSLSWSYLTSHKQSDSDRHRARRRRELPRLPYLCSLHQYIFLQPVLLLHPHTLLQQHVAMLIFWRSDWSSFALIGSPGMSLFVWTLFPLVRLAPPLPLCRRPPPVPA